MKKLTLLLASVFGLVSVSTAHDYGYANINSYADAFVFDEMGVTFSVYPDGEFDFYLGDACQSSTISNGYVSATFNSGYDYNPYVQYDDFGAVVQVENVPVWYDYYGRVTQIGDVDVSYRSSRVCRVGGLYVNYNRHGNYAYHTGFINSWNPYFVYRPFYVAFARPVVNLCFVRTTPYRQYYAPVRYAYYRPYVRNVRPHYATIGHTYRPSSGRGVVHSSYRQSAGRGEVAFKRERRAVTTASVRQQTVANRADNTNARTTTQRSTSGVRNAPTQRTSSNNISSIQRTNVGSTSRQGTRSRSVKPNTTLRQTPSSMSRGTSSTRTAPARTNSSSVSRNSGRSSANTQSRATSKPSSAVKPISTSRQSSSSRGSVKSTPNRTNSSARTQTSRSAVKPQTRSRASSSKPAASSKSRVSSLRGSSNVKASSPSRGLSKGTTSRSSSRREK